MNRIVNWIDMIQDCCLQQNQLEIIIMFAENISLLKSQLHSGQQTYNNPIELGIILRQKEVVVAQLSRKVELKRQEMKEMSKYINQLISKQQRKPVKQRPSFHPEFSNKKLTDLREEKDQIFKQIEETKKKIKDHKQSQPQGMVEETLTLQATMAKLEKVKATIEDEKRLLITTLEQNKTNINKLKQNSCLIDLQKKQVQYEQIKKQCKLFEKEINSITAQQLQNNAYLLQITTKAQTEVVQKVSINVDQNEMKQLLIDINRITEQRNHLQKESHSRIRRLEKVIEQLEKSMKQKQINIRQMQNDMLRASIQIKRQTFSLNKQDLKRPSPKSSEIKLVKINNPQQKKIVNKIYLAQKQEGNSLCVGQWNNNKVLSDKAEIPLNSIIVIKKIIFYICNGALASLKTSYLDKNNIEIEGKKMNISSENNESEIEIQLGQLTHLEYSRKKPIYIRFIFQDGSYKQIGQRIDLIERINLQHFNFKFIEAQVSESLSEIIGLKFTLQEKPIDEKIQQQEQKAVTQHSFSNTELSVKKRVILKGRSLKKIRQLPFIDHRLMLGKNKMV